MSSSPAASSTALPAEPIGEPIGEPFFDQLAELSPASSADALGTEESGSLAGRAAPQVHAQAVIIGAGPAGLMAAEVLSQAGVSVQVFDAMPSAGRKFLLAGKGGLNLTHSEPLADFIQRYAERADEVARWLEVLSPQGLRDWAAGLGISTFVGSSGKVFPAEMKAAPLLRAWMHRLRQAGVKFHMRYRWVGDGLSAMEPSAQSLANTASAEQAARQSDEDASNLPAHRQLSFQTPNGLVTVRASVVLLALGGASWARLGSDGAWVQPLKESGVAISPLKPANCGFDLAWSPYIVQRFAGTPLKNVRLHFSLGDGRRFDRLGEAVLSATGLEGNLIYAASAWLRDELASQGSVTIALDLLPHRSEQQVQQALARGRGSRSWTNHLKETLGLAGLPAALLREALTEPQWQSLWASPAELAARIKALPLSLLATRPLDEAISTAGGVCLEALNERLMLKQIPGLFCAGEMLDWEAPTGGYLLTATMASGRVAGQGMLAYLEQAGRRAPDSAAG